MRLTEREKEVLGQLIGGEIDPRYSGYGTPESRAEIANILATVDNRFATNRPTQYGGSSVKSYSTREDVAKQRSSRSNYGQFSPFNPPDYGNTGKRNYEKNKKEIDQVIDAYFQGIETPNAPQSTHYYNPDIVTPSWASSLDDFGRTGGHQFRGDARSKSGTPTANPITDFAGLLDTPLYGHQAPDYAYQTARPEPKPDVSAPRGLLDGVVDKAGTFVGDAIRAGTTREPDYIPSEGPQTRARVTGSGSPIALAAQRQAPVTPVERGLLADLPSQRINDAFSAAEAGRRDFQSPVNDRIGSAFATAESGRRSLPSSGALGPAYQEAAVPRIDNAFGLFGGAAPTAPTFDPGATYAAAGISPNARIEGAFSQFDTPQIASQPAGVGPLSDKQTLEGNAAMPMSVADLGIALGAPYGGDLPQEGPPLDEYGLLGQSPQTAQPVQQPVQQAPQQPAPISQSRSIGTLPAPRGFDPRDVKTVAGAVPSVAEAVGKYGLPQDPGNGMSYGFSPWGSGIAQVHSSAPDRVQAAASGPGLFGAFKDDFGIDLTPSPAVFGGMLAGPIGAGAGLLTGSALAAAGPGLANSLGGTSWLTDRMDVVPASQRAPSTGQPTGFFGGLFGPGGLFGAPAQAAKSAKGLFEPGGLFGGRDYNDSFESAEPRSVGREAGEAIHSGTSGWY